MVVYWYLYSVKVVLLRFQNIIECLYAKHLINPTQAPLPPAVRYRLRIVNEEENPERLKSSLMVYMLPQGRAEMYLTLNSFFLSLSLLLC